MKKNQDHVRSDKFKKWILIALQIIIIITVIYLNNDKLFKSETIVITSTLDNKKAPIILEKKEEIVPPKEEVIVFDGLTMEELTNKLNKSLNGVLNNKGNLFAIHSTNYGVDPYLATAIMLLETGCKWNCSYIATACNNFGGITGYPACGNSGYKAYNSIEEGIEGLFKNLYYNYYQYGLTDAYSIHKKYAQDPNWAIYVNNYINEIKAK